MAVPALYKNIWYVVLVQKFIQVQMSAKDLALAGLYDESVYAFLQKLLQVFCLHGSGIPGVFKDYTVTIFCHDLVYPLHYPGKNIVSQIGCNHCNIMGFPGGWQH